MTVAGIVRPLWGEEPVVVELTRPAEDEGNVFALLLADAAELVRRCQPESLVVSGITWHEYARTEDEADDVFKLTLVMSGTKEQP